MDEQLSSAESLIEKLENGIVFVMHSDVNNEKYIIRRQARSINGKISDFCKKFPAAKQIYRADNVPGGINIFMLLRKAKKIQGKRNKFTSELTNDELANEIDVLCPELKKLKFSLFEDLALSEC